MTGRYLALERRCDDWGVKCGLLKSRTNVRNMKLGMWLVLGSDEQAVGMEKCMLTMRSWREIGRCDEKGGCEWKLWSFWEKGKESSERKLSGSGRDMKIHVWGVI